MVSSFPCFEPGKKYRIVHQSMTQRRPRESVMVFLSTQGSEHHFSARPVAGTQILPDNWILDWKEVPAETVPYVSRRR